VPGADALRLTVPGGASTAPGEDVLRHERGAMPGAMCHPQPRSRCATSAANRAQARPSWARSGPGIRQSHVAAQRPRGRLDEDANRATGVLRSINGGRPEDPDQAQAGLDRARAGQSSARPASRPSARQHGRLVVFTAGMPPAAGATTRLRDQSRTAERH
jgi:hypothetical protein